MSSKGARLKQFQIRFRELYGLIFVLAKGRRTIACRRYPLHTGINSYIPEDATYGLPLEEETLAQVSWAWQDIRQSPELLNGEEFWKCYID